MYFFTISISNRSVFAFFHADAMLNVLDRLTFSEATSAGPFLNDCNVNKSLQFILYITLFSCFNFTINVLSLQIYLAGFPANIRDKLNRIFNMGGATRFDDISGAVTHVIVRDEDKASAKLKAIKSRGLWYNKK